MFPSFSLALSLVALTTISSIAVNALPTQNRISLVNAPLTSALSRRIVYSPRIISPAQGDIWNAGSWAEVTWFVFYFSFSDVLSFLSLISSLHIQFQCYIEYRG
jgi:hypothetical protein